MIVTSFQNLKKFLGKQISPIFSYFLKNNALLYHFWANLLAHNQKMTEKSVCREAPSFQRHITTVQMTVLDESSVVFAGALADTFRCELT